MELVDLGKISKAISGFADLIGRLAKSIEQAIKSGLRSADAVRKAREQRRLDNFFLITAHLYPQQGQFVSTIKWFCDDQDRGSWEEAKFEILTINRLLHKIEKYVLPYNDVLVGQHRQQYLEILTALHERRKLLDFVYHMEYEEALLHIKELKAIAKAYELLQQRLQRILLSLASRKKDSGDEDEDEPPFGSITVSDPLRPLVGARERRSGRQERKRLSSQPKRRLKN